VKDREEEERKKRERAREMGERFSGEVLYIMFTWYLFFCSPGLRL
jgi:hypothetical protein